MKDTFAIQSLAKRSISGLILSAGRTLRCPLANRYLLQEVTAAGGEGVIRFDEYIGLRHDLQHMHFLHAFFSFHRK